MKVEFEAIKEFCDRVAEAYNPHKIILFGSHARGDATENSDVDILVIMDFEGDWVDTATEIRMAVKRKFPLDLLVMTLDYIKQRSNFGDYFVAEIFEEGRVMYESECAKVGR